jgi:uncharacterized protein involved in exopolysaccharide biosynthesis
MDGEGETGRTTSGDLSPHRQNQHHPIAPMSPNGTPGPAYNYASAGTGEDAVNLWDYVGILMRRRWTVVTIFAASVLVALILSVAATPMYKATALVQIQPNGPTS